MVIKQRILLIEDEEIVSKTIVRILSFQGYEVECADNGKKAIEMALNKDFDLIITDIRLPGDIDGIDTVKKIKEMKPDMNCPIIVITGYADQDAPIRAIKVKVDDFIYKPFATDVFLHSVKKNLKISELEKQKKLYVDEINKMRYELEQYSLSLEDKVEDRTRQLSLLFEIGRELTSSLKLDEVLSDVLDRMANVLNIEICSILLWDDKNHDLVVSAIKGLPGETIVGTRIKPGECISGTVFQDKKLILIENIDSDPVFAKREDEKYYKGSLISAPLVYKNNSIGVINANNKKSGETFNRDDLSLVEGIADYASIAIENARLYSNLKGVYMQIVATLTSIIEMKDHYTKGHSERVTDYSVAIAIAMGMLPTDVELVRLACQLHDLGKIGIDENILTKPGKLTDEEWNKMKMHPTKGVDILRPLSFLSEIIKLVEQHHERYDGKGYPCGYKAENIDLKARIMAVADSFDAMTTDRPYSKALTMEKALEELKRCSGTQFDPVVVGAFVQLLENNPDLFTKIKNKTR